MLNVPCHWLKWNLSLMWRWVLRVAWPRNIVFTPSMGDEWSSVGKLALYLSLTIQCWQVRQRPVWTVDASLLNPIVSSYQSIWEYSYAIDETSTIRPDNTWDFNMLSPQSWGSRYSSPELEGKKCGGPTCAPLILLYLRKTTNGNNAVPHVLL